MLDFISPDHRQLRPASPKAPTFGALPLALSLQSYMAQASLSTGFRSHLLLAVVAMTN